MKKPNKEVNSNETSSKTRNRSNNKSSRSKRTDKRDDQFKVKGKLKDLRQNPNWYFKDAEQAEVMSRIQMNAFGAVSKMGNFTNPTVMAFYTNPCPGVTLHQTGDTDPDSNWKAKGINRAAQKLWYILTAKSGRSAGYTKADCAILILAIGAMIETYEFIRRVFAISYVYGQRNRSLPTLLWRAMGVNSTDYMRNAAPYLKRMNTLMAIMNQLPIPGNIAWFAKCQDIFQNIFMDYPDEMAQFLVFSPSTTWVVEEDDGFIGGSYLRTVDMCVTHDKGSSSSGPVIGYDTSNLPVRDANAVCANRTLNNLREKNLSYYIDVFETQINKLLFSSTFSNIYSDILRAFDNGTLSRWSFDYIDEKYQIAPIYDENRLWMIHNMLKPCGFRSKTRSYFQTNWDSSDVSNTLQYGTPMNDVYQWASTDVLIYEPTISFQGQVNSGSPVQFYLSETYVDFPNDKPTVEQRIDYTRYMISVDQNAGDVLKKNFNSVQVVSPTTAYNFELPDHWVELCEILTGMAEVPHLYSDAMFITMDIVNDCYGTTGNFDRGQDWSKFHHAPLFYVSDAGDCKHAIYGEVNAWASIKPEWFMSINDMIYVDLFDIR